MSTKLSCMWAASSANEMHIPAYVEALQLLVLSQVFSTYRFTFDHVYAHDAAQADVYMNSARESVLNALQVIPLLPVLCCMYVACRLTTTKAYWAHHQQELTPT